MRLRKQCIEILVSLFIVLAISAHASNNSFSTDVEAINVAAQSVLMLEIYDSKDELIATGSGFVAFDNYTLITNEHVIENAELIIAYSDTGNQYMVTKLISADKKRDIAILEFFSPTDLIPLTLNNQDEIRRAEQIVAIGSPLGLKNAVSFGNISALYQDDDVSLIQFTAPISSGSSGGALFNDKAQVIGITSGSFTDGQNINLAVSISEVMSLYETTSTNERIKLSKYKTSITTPTAILTAKPTKKPAITPHVTKNIEVGIIHFNQSKGFDNSPLENYKGYEYDKFDKKWSYLRYVRLEKNRFFALDISNEPSLITDFYTSLSSPPRIIISDSSITKPGAFINQIDILVGDKIYTYQTIRYYAEIEGYMFLYLGSIGKQMIEEVAKAKTISIRLTLRDYTKVTYDLKSQDFAPLGTWCKNIVKHQVFDYFYSSELTIANNAHKAYIH